MSNGKTIDPFVSTEPEVDVDAATSRILLQRMETAGQSRLVPAKEARERIHQCLSKSSTTKTR